MIYKGFKGCLIEVGMVILWFWNGLRTFECGMIVEAGREAAMAFWRSEVMKPDHDREHWQLKQ